VRVRAESRVSMLQVVLGNVSWTSHRVVAVGGYGCHRPMIEAMLVCYPDDSLDEKFRMSVEPVAE
jgi:hypothetical protein